MCMTGDSSCSFGMTENEIPRRACALARNDIMLGMTEHSFGDSSLTFGMTWEEET